MTGLQGDKSAFELSLDEDNDDDAFLLDATILNRRSRGFFAPPLAWYRLSHRERGCIKALGAVSTALCACILAFVLLATWLTPQQGATVPACAWEEYRLGNETQPQQYDIHLSVELDTYTVHGEMALHVLQKSPASCFRLHSDASVSVTDVVVTTGGQRLSGAHRLSCTLCRTPLGESIDIMRCLRG